MYVYYTYTVYQTLRPPEPSKIPIADFHQPSFRDPEFWRPDLQACSAPSVAGRTWAQGQISLFQSLWIHPIWHGLPCLVRTSMLNESMNVGLALEISTSKIWFCSMNSMGYILFEDFGPYFEGVQKTGYPNSWMVYMVYTT